LYFLHNDVAFCEKAKCSSLESNCLLLSLRIAATSLLNTETLSPILYQGQSHSHFIITFPYHGYRLVYLQQPGNSQCRETVPDGPPRVALKLSPAAHRKQLAGSDINPSSILTAEPELGLVSRVGPLITSQSSAAIAQKVALVAELDPKYGATNFDTWYQFLLGPQVSITAMETEESRRADGGLSAFPEAS
jgi:hypothetical protein